MRTFFKLYSLPIMVVVIGLGLYAAVVFVMKDNDLILAKAASVKSPTTQSQGIDQNPVIIDEVASGAKGENIEVAQVPNEMVPNEVPNDTAQGAGQNLAQVEPQPNELGTEQSNSEQSNEQPAQIGTNEPESSPDSEAHVTNTQVAQTLPAPQPSQPSQIAQTPATKGQYRYAKHRINIRQAPSSEAHIISRAVVGEALELLGFEGEWSRVKSSYGIEGYVASRLLAETPTQGDGEAYIVLPTALNVRLKPDSESAIIGRLSHNMRIGVIETHEGWGKVQLPNKQYGYVSLEHLRKAN